MTIVAILAAGRSSRFGATKALATIGDETLIASALRRSKETKKPVVVVTGYDAENIDRHLGDVATTFNRDWEQGLSTSIRCAVCYARSQHADGLLIMLVDQPGITTEHLLKLIETKNLVGTLYPDGTIGVPAFFDASFFNDLLELKGDTGAKSVLARNECAYVRFDVVEDVDTTGDLHGFSKETLT